MRLRRSFRLNPCGEPLESLVVYTSIFSLRTAGNENVHRFDEIINGREYHIEVSSVGAGQYRAQIARTPGGSAALMPFYGKTPNEAAKQLSHWLEVAHGKAKSRV